ncbi:MAG: hypothetical protein ACREMK_04435 [Gemmatimonadota bacterium]
MNSRTAGMIGLVPLLAVSAVAPLAAQDSARAATTQDSADRASDTVVARFHLPKGALADATNSEELIAALRENLTIDLAMPLDEPLRVHLRGWAGAEGGDSPAYNFVLSPLGVGYSGQGPLDGFSYSLAVRESHGEDFPPDGDEWDEFDADDWDEDEAWSRLVKALDVGLPQSAPGFERPGPGEHVALRVVEVHTHDFALAARDSGWGEYSWCCLEDYEGAVLQIQPDASFQSEMMGDSSADGLFHRRNILVVDLQPGVAEASPAAGNAPGAIGADSAADAEALKMTEELQIGCHMQVPWLVSAASSVSRLELGGNKTIGHAAVGMDPDNPNDPYLMAQWWTARGLLVSHPVGPWGPVRARQLRGVPPVGGPGPRSGRCGEPVVLRVAGHGAGSRDAVRHGVRIGEIESVEPGFRGRFELEGWTTNDGIRTNDVSVSGSFTATDR